MIAVARILMPASMVRLSAGRLSLSDEAQALCFVAGANSIFIGERLLTTPNPETDRDLTLLNKLGLRLLSPIEVSGADQPSPAAEAAEAASSGCCTLIQDLL
jgi:biotin synthase